MTRAATADELVKLRSDNQWSKLFLAIHKPASVYTARVNQSTFADPVAQVTFDGGSGTLANVLPGMTIYFGSTAGAHDKGMARVRKAPTSTLLYIGEASECELADNLYITVVNEFAIWARHLTLVNNVPFMDYDIAYSDQHSNFTPVPVIGSHAVLWLTGATVNYSPDASGSWVPGSTISAYSWAAPGASATANLTTATPTITYNAAGTYRVACTITAANGKTSTSYRYVFVYSAASQPVTQFEVKSCYGDFESGGWQFKVKMRAEAGISDVRDRALVILFAEDFYSGSAGSIGPLAGAENIIAVGWIAGESIDYDASQGEVEFEVRGPNWWLDQIDGYSIGVEHTETTPAAWTEINDLTVDKALHHLIIWRSTLINCVDVTLTGDTRLASALESQTGTLWKQIQAIAESSILATPICDRYGRLTVEIDPQYISDRSGVTVVQSLTGADWGDTLHIERQTVNKVGRVDASGVSWDGVKATPLFSRSPGNVFSRAGDILSKENLLLSTQAELNTLTGLIFAKENNEYPAIDVTLAQNNRLIDIAPRQFLKMSVLSTDTPRGITWTDQVLLPRRVEYDFGDGGRIFTVIELEALTDGPASAVTVTPPTIPVPNFPDLPDWDNYDYAVMPSGYDFPNDFIPDEPEPDPDSLCYNTIAAPENGPYDLVVYGIKTEEHDVAAAFNCYIRSSAHTNMTRYAIHGKFQVYDHDTDTWKDTTDDDFYQVQAGSIVGVKDAVSDPYIRTGVLPGGDVSQLVNSIRLTWPNRLLLRPDVVSVTFARDNPVFTLDSSGTQVWWPKGAGLGFAWNGITGHTGGGPTIATIYFEIRFQAPDGTSYNRRWKIFTELKWTGGNLDTSTAKICAGGGLTFSPIGDYHRAPADEEQHFANWHCPVTLATAFTIKAPVHPLTYYANWTFELKGEIQPCPYHRIIIDSFVLYNICPPLS